MALQGGIPGSLSLRTQTTGTMCLRASTDLKDDSKLDGLIQRPGPAIGAIVTAGNPQESRKVFPPERKPTLNWAAAISGKQ